MSDRHSSQKIADLAVELGRLSLQNELLGSRIKGLEETNDELRGAAHRSQQDLQSLRGQLEQARRTAAEQRDANKLKPTPPAEDWSRPG